MPKGVYVRTKPSYWLGKKKPYMAAVNKSRKWTSEMRERISESNTGEKSHKWKGDKVGYDALHDWVKRQKGKAKKCEHCGTKTAKRYEWANIDHEYRRNVDDFIELCPKCHRKHDRENNLARPK